MTHTPSRRLQRRATGLAAAFALGVSALGATTLGGLAPASAAPAADCKDAFPLASLTTGASLDGLTVTTGTTPQTFHATVLGVVGDGIAPGIPMIVVKVDPTGLTLDDPQVQGIWEGMSGSPLYSAADPSHRLVGAISYALSSTQSWIAGVTPFSEMTSYRGTGSSAHVRLDARTERAVVAASGASPAQVDQGFRRLPVMQGVSGVPAAALSPSARLQTRHAWLTTGARPMGRVTGSALDTLDPSADTVIAGGNLAVSLAYGDVALAGIGTATSVCDNEVVGFGHPMNFGGESTLALHSATSLYIQGSTPSFKVANLGPVVGTVFGDHMTGVTASFGSGPATTSVASSLTYGSRSRTGTAYVADRTASTLALVGYYELLANQTRVLDGQFPGSEVLTWTIQGTDAAAKPFTLTWTNRYLGQMSVADETGFRIGDVVNTIASMPGVTINSVTTSGTASRSIASYNLLRIEQKRGSHWVRVTQRAPAQAKAGGRLYLRAVLQGPTSTTTVPLTLTVPKKTSGRVVQLLMVGGNETGLTLGTSVASARTAISKAVRADTVLAVLGKVSDVPIGGGGGEGDLGLLERTKARAVSFSVRATSSPLAGVVGGMSMVPVSIR